MNVLESILSVYPEAKDCTEGHIGEPIDDTYDEVDDDRYYRIKIKRCGHCRMVISEGDYAE